MKRNLILTSVIFFLATVSASAAVYTVPLQVPGPMPLNTPVPFSFNVGTALVSVNSVSIEWKGTIRPLIDYWGEPGANHIEAGLGTGPSAAALSPEIPPTTLPQPFDATSPFGLTPGSNWDFLLSGSGSGYFLYEHPNNPPLSFPWQQPGIASLDEAALIIDGVPVPEPATGLLLALIAGSGLMCRRRRTD